MKRKVFKMIDTKSAAKIVELFGYSYNKYLPARNKIIKDNNYIENYFKLKEIETAINSEIFTRLWHDDKLLFTSLRGTITPHWPTTSEEVVECMYNNNEFSKPFNVYSDRIEEFDMVLCRFFGNISNSYSITIKE